MQVLEGFFHILIFCTAEEPFSKPRLKPRLQPWFLPVFYFGSIKTSVQTSAIAVVFTVFFQSTSSNGFNSSAIMRLCRIVCRFFKSKGQKNLAKIRQCRNSAGFQNAYSSVNHLGTKKTVLIIECIYFVYTLFYI